MKKEALEIFQAALEAADPFKAVKRSLRLERGRLLAGGEAYDLRAFERVIVVGAGKGTAPMAEAVEDLLGERIEGGLIIVKYGHTRPLKRVLQVEAAHPLPDESGVRATLEIIRLLEGADEKTLLVCLLSGGASALLTAPCEGITLEEKRATTGLVMGAGADIFELNAVRKHISRVKGGRLAEFSRPATLLTLIMSDVIGDRLDTIASGPTVPDETTFSDAMAVVDKYGLYDRLPPSVIGHLREGVTGRIQETPKGKEDFSGRTKNLIVGSLKGSLEAASARASELGFSVTLLTSELRGEAREAARYLAGKALEAGHRVSKPGLVCLLSGGETTVTVRGKGTGGRNQELALAFALEVEGTSGITLLSGATDGTDGPTDSAGAVVDGATVEKARRAGLDPEAFLDANDSYAFFERLDTSTGENYHLKTGPTGTNVMDVQIIIVE